MQDPHSIAAQYWGFSSFRPLQEEIINSIGKAHIDTIALLPTGGGKSLCFQIPALANEGIAIVISPLIALMKDQVTGLKEKGIKALAIPSGIPFQELDALLDNCLYGNYKLLYLSPERLQQELVLERIKQMNVSLIAVDEAHCISQWGHDFRPAYREIYKLREIKPEVPIIALTATATPKVIEDISEQLHLRTPKLFQSSYYRANLIYTIQYSTDKNYALEQLLKEIKGSAIVYVRNRKGAIQIAQYLKARGILSTSYHGGMPQDERNKNYIAWRKDSVQVMVGTSAFGMGIDKGNVDIVIHLEIPDSVENYFQEAGRAGRNGQAAKAVLLYNENDLLRLDNQFIKVIPHVADVKEVYKRLNAYFQVSYGEGAQTTHHFNFSDFCQTYKLPTIRTFNALQVLDRNSVISLSQEFFKRATVYFKVSDMALTYYLVKNPGLDEVTKTILRTYGGIHEQLTAINYSVIANKSNSSIAKVHQTLLTLDTDDVIDYEHKSYDTALTFLVPREDDRTINVIASYIKTQANYKEKQVSQVKAFINNKEQCRAISLLGYFGEVLETPCGLCDVCLNAKPAALNSEDIHTFVLKALATRELGSKEIISYLNNEYAAVRFRESDILESLKILLSEDKIVITASNTYKLQ